jgi:hypothetical protein
MCSEYRRFCPFTIGLIVRNRGFGISQTDLDFRSGNGLEIFKQPVKSLSDIFALFKTHTPL